ncbi:MAG: dihydrofolate reductase [bacterium]|nr:dihydrofolate reductase [bacterium]
MAIIGIVAVAENLAIGRGGKLPWHYPADLKHFKKTTMDNAIVMGSNTWRSIGKPLPGRLNVVLSRRAQLDTDENLLFLRSEDEAAALSKFLRGDLYVIGGAHIYEAFAPLIDAWIVTEIPETIGNADVFMPANYLEAFKLIDAEELDDGLVVRRYERS